MGPGALALLGRALKALLDETHFFSICVCAGCAAVAACNFLALAACKSVSDAPTAVLATGVGGELTRRRRRLGRGLDA